MPFDDNCAVEYALLVAGRIRRGHIIAIEDGQIDATALSSNLSLATRNVKDFKAIEGLNILSLWA